MSYSPRDSEHGRPPDAGGSLVPADTEDSSIAGGEALDVVQTTEEQLAENPAGAFPDASSPDASSAANVDVELGDDGFQHPHRFAGRRDHQCVGGRIRPDRDPVFPTAGRRTALLCARLGLSGDLRCLVPQSAGQIHL